MSGLSSQALALFLVLSPGFLFIVGTYAAPLVYPVRIDLQRGVVVDTAIFVVISAALHSTLGLAFLEITNALSTCSVIRSLAADASIVLPPSPLGRCEAQTDLLVAISYSVFLSVAAFRIGVAAAKYVARHPELFTAVYGPYFDLVQPGSGAYVIADVMTKTSHEGRVLVYEGYLVELSLNGSRGINFVCLEGASRFYLTLGRDAARTTVRNKFSRIDLNSERVSRISIPGSEISNLVTRTHTGVDVAPSTERAPADLSRRALLLLRWLTVGR